jgi:hypothetical protein
MSTRAVVDDPKTQAAQVSQHESLADATIIGETPVTREEKTGTVEVADSAVIVNVDNMRFDRHTLPALLRRCSGRSSRSRDADDHGDPDPRVRSLRRRAPGPEAPRSRSTASAGRSRRRSVSAAVTARSSASSRSPPCTSTSRTPRTRSARVSGPARDHGPGTPESRDGVRWSRGAAAAPSDRRPERVP